MEKAMDPNEVRIFSGRSHPELAAGIAQNLGLPLQRTYFSRFSNDNLFIQLCASVRGRTVYIIQSLIPPVSDHLMELFMMLNIAQSAAAKDIHAIIPYFSYARSDKKNAPRISITARLIADLLVTSGATQVMTMTLHSPQVHGFFSVPTDPLTARGLFVSYFRQKDWDKQKTIVVAPDYGRAASAARLANQLGLHSISAEKKRVTDTEVIVDTFVGKQVTGYTRALIYDDEIATGGSIIELTKILINNGIQEVHVVATHGLLTGNAVEKIGEIPEIKEIVVTNTVPIAPSKRHDKLVVLSVAPIFAEAIKANYLHQSIGDLFTFWDEQDAMS